MLFLTLVSSLCYAGLTLVFAARVYERNSLLLGGKESFTGILEFKRTPGDRPTAGVAMFLFSLVLVISYYGSLALQSQGVPVMLTTIEYVFFLAPAVLFALAKGYDLKETFSLRLPAWQGALGGILLGLSAWTVAGGLIVRLFPPPESFTKAMQKIVLMEDHHLGIGVMILLIAVSPALCEEIFFRGMVMSGFRRLGMWPAILCTALLFGVAHASIYRLLPTVALGIGMGFATWKTRSILAGMLVHVCNNGLIVVMAKEKFIGRLLRLDPHSTNLPWSHVLVGAAVAAIGVYLIQSCAKAQPAAPTAEASAHWQAQGESERTCR
jgi:sodium transport system permease protein